MKKNRAKLDLVPISLMNDKDWEDYYYIGKDRIEDSSENDKIQEFKNQRISQNESAPSWVSINEFLLKYKNESIGWLASFESENLSFISDTIYDDIPNEVLKALLIEISEIMSKCNREFALFSTTNVATCNKLKLLDAELFDESESEKQDSQFKLNREFIKAMLEKS
jgi:hypothetical protein